jgi:hypothetical protein
LIANQTTFGQFYFKNQKEDHKITVKDENRKVYQFPWAGGMNSCQFGNIDLNLDGIADLFVFDRNGNRILTFINGGTSNNVDYSYAPEYIPKFPELFGWAILIDYNDDGKNDIFTYSPPVGIRVFKNVSDTELEFVPEVETYLTSFQGSGYVNIFATDADYAGITDVDNDGDIDILNFWVLGAFVEYHQNQSIEKWGIPDSLDFVKVTSCWGHFAENEESNILYLDTCGGFINSEPRNRHAGSTMLLIDLDGDNDKDLLLGDVDYPTLVGLVNGGNPDSAYMISQDTVYPGYNKPVMLFSMPAAAYIDVDNNNVKDLILSPFDPSPITSENHQSVWLYENNGSNEVPDFNFIKGNFLQEDMIDVGSGAYPILFDYNNDGLKDLFISNFGYYIYSWYGPANTLHSVYWSNIALYENNGTTSSPAFNKVTHDFAGLHSYHLTGIYPAFGDLDGDGDFDMIIGHQGGNLWYFENMAGLSQEPEFSAPDENYLGIDVGEFSAPQLFDFDLDGDLDLIIGEQDGNLNYYQNNGSQVNPDFIYVTDSLGKVNVTDYTLSYNGYSTPCFFYNPENEIELLVGSEQGKIFYFKNIPENPEEALMENDSLFLLIDDEPFILEKGMRTAASISDLNNDGFLDLIVGNYSGGLHYYAGTGQPQVSGSELANYEKNHFRLFPNPANDILNLEISKIKENTDLIMKVYNLYGNMVLKTKPSNHGEVNLSTGHLPNGIYLLKVEEIDSGQILFDSKFIISR